jgi:cytochrome c-type biogenesis protein CcmH
MTSFWLICALFVLGALLFLLPPLLRRPAPSRAVSRSKANLAIYRDQRAELDGDLHIGLLTPAQHQDSLRDLERQLLADSAGDASETGGKQRRAAWLAALVVAIGVPVTAVGLYFLMGNFDALAPRTVQTGKEITPQQLAAMVEQLARRLKVKPNDAQGWSMLARSYAVLERYPDAAAAYEKAVALQPRSAQLRADYGDLLATAAGGNLQGRPLAQLQTALVIDPRNPKALALAGTAAFNQNDFANAVLYWRRLLETVPKDSEEARSILATIAEAEAAQEKALPKRAEDRSPTLPRIQGSVNLSPELAAKVKPDDTLFIFARAANGPRMPLAIIKGRASELPREFTLDDSMAMNPALKLSGVAQVEVGARISRSGNALPQSGDLQGNSAPVAVGSTGVKVMIDRIVP